MRTGVILATYGEPQRNSLPEQWMYSYRILKGLTRKIARIPKPLLPIIATARARGRVRLWSRHGFTSPLESLHLGTVQALRAELSGRGHGGDVIVAPAYEFRRPSLADVLDDLAGHGCGRAVIVPMYVAGGDFTDGMTRSAVAEALQGSTGRRWNPGQISFCPLSDEPEAARRLGTILAGHCLEALARCGVQGSLRDWGLMLAAHGTVVNPPAGVDNGLAHFERVLRAVRDTLEPRFGAVGIGWLNHTRGGQWTTPAMPDALALMSKSGFSRLAYFPWGFTTDNAETLLEGRIALAGVRGSFQRIEHLPCVNADAAFISYLADRVGLHLERPAIAQEHPRAAVAV